MHVCVTGSLSSSGLTYVLHGLVLEALLCWLVCSHSVYLHKIYVYTCK